DQRNDRGIEQQEADRGGGGQEPAGAAHGLRPSTTALWARCIRTIGITTMTSRVMASAAARGQLVLEKNSSHRMRPIIWVPGPPSREGMTNSPIAGMKTSMAPAMTPGMESGNVTERKVCQGREPRSADASKIGRAHV